MICEPLILTKDADGEWHFSPEGLPARTVIDTFNLPFRPWAKRERGKLTIELDGREAIYDRIGYTPEGHWVCQLRVDPAKVVG